MNDEDRECRGFKKMSKEELREMGNGIIAGELEQLFKENNCFERTRIYFNNCAYDSKNGFVEDIDPSEYMDISAKDYVTMSFEGVLHNYLQSPGNRVRMAVDSIANKYNRKLVFGNDWNARIIPINEEEI